MIVNNNALQSILDHLEFLGYECEGFGEDEDKKNPSMVIAKHKTESNILIEAKYAANIAYFYVMLTFSEKQLKNIIKKNEEFLEILNEINKKSSISTFSYDRKGEKLNINTWKELSYSKRDFATFLQLIKADIANISDLLSILD